MYPGKVISKREGEDAEWSFISEKQEEMYNAMWHNFAREMLGAYELQKRQ